MFHIFKITTCNHERFRLKAWSKQTLARVETLQLPFRMVISKFKHKHNNSNLDTIYWQG